MTVKAAAPVALGARGTLIMLWATIGLVALLGNALMRLTPIAIEPITGGQLTGLQIAVVVAWVAFNAYAEGYRGFQRRFSPRFAARALHLARHPRPVHVLFAPLFCMGFFHATRRLRIVSWSVTLGIIVLVWGVRHLDQPWRGIVDAGVVVGLTWGLIATLVYLWMGVWRQEVPCSPDLPEVMQRLEPGLDPHAC